MVRVGPVAYAVQIMPLLLELLEEIRRTEKSLQIE